MTALAAARNTEARVGATLFNGPVKASAKLYLGALVALSAGLLVPGSTATGLIAVGRNVRQVDNSAGADSALSADVDTARVFQFVNGDGIAAADIGSAAYILDDQTVTKGNSGQSPAGIIVDVSTNGVWIEMSVAISRMLTAAAAGSLAQAAYQVDEFTPAPAATSTTALHAALATTVAAQTVLAAAMVAGGIAALLAHPRNLTFTGGATTADCPSTVAIAGTDIDSNALAETVALTAGSGTGVKCFKTVTSVVYGAAASTSGTEAIGIGSVLGLSKTIKSRAGRLSVIQEVADASGTGSVVTNGVFAGASTSPPHGSYAPNAPPDGTYQWSVTYEHS